VAKKFRKLTRASMRRLSAGESLSEHGIVFRRMRNGDGRYAVNVMVDRERIHRVIGRESEGVTRQQAEDFISSIRTDARRGRLNLPRGRKVVLGFREASQKYLEKLEVEGGKDINKKRQRLKQHLSPFFDNKPLSKLSSFDIERYKKSRLGFGAAKATINRELAVLSHLMSKAVEWEWVAHRPAIIRRFDEDNRRTSYLTAEQVQSLVSAAAVDSSPIYLFVVIALDTSMRRSEILSIRLENVDVERRLIFVPTAKAGAREQPITKNLALILRAHLDYTEPDQEWLFPSPRSASGHTVNIEKSWRRVVLAAGLDPNLIVRHTLRHTAITHLVQAGVDLPTVMRISGHKTLLMVQRYAHQNGKHIDSAMEKLERRYATKE